MLVSCGASQDSSSDGQVRQSFHYISNQEGVEGQSSSVHNEIMYIVNKTQIENRDYSKLVSLDRNGESIETIELGHFRALKVITDSGGVTLALQSSEDESNYFQKYSFGADGKLFKNWELKMDKQGADKEYPNNWFQRAGLNKLTSVTGIEACKEANGQLNSIIFSGISPDPSSSNSHAMPGSITRDGELKSLESFYNLSNDLKYKLAFIPGGNTNSSGCPNTGVTIFQIQYEGDSAVTTKLGMQTYSASGPKLFKIKEAPFFYGENSLHGSTYGDYIFTSPEGNHYLAGHTISELGSNQQGSTLFISKFSESYGIKSSDVYWSKSIKPNDLGITSDNFGNKSLKILKVSLYRGEPLIFSYDENSKNYFIILLKDDNGDLVSFQKVSGANSSFKSLVIWDDDVFLIGTKIDGSFFNSIVKKLAPF